MVISTELLLAGCSHPSAGLLPLQQELELLVQTAVRGMSGLSWGLAPLEE